MSKIDEKLREAADYITNTLPLTQGTYDTDLMLTLRDIFRLGWEERHALTKHIDSAVEPLPAAVLSAAERTVDRLKAEVERERDEAETWATEAREFRDELSAAWKRQDELKASLAEREREVKRLGEWWNAACLERDRAGLVGMSPAQAIAWLSGDRDEVNRLVRTLDEAMHGEEDAARQAMLCDLIPLATRQRALLRDLVGALEPLAFCQLFGGPTPSHLGKDCCNGCRARAALSRAQEVAPKEDVMVECRHCANPTSRIGGYCSRECERAPKEDDDGR